MVKTHLLIRHYVAGYTLKLPRRGYFNVYLQHMLLKIRKKTIWKITFSKYHVHSFKHPKLPISIKIPVCLYLHDNSISKFEFMNYLFANLLVVWLYVIT